MNPFKHFFAPMFEIWCRPGPRLLVIGPTVGSLKKRNIRINMTTPMINIWTESDIGQNQRSLAGKNRQ
jgi:hypothetical protein